MVCPKCQKNMRTVDKSGVHIEQCEGCRGIFLDRGELEQIANAESAYYAEAAPPPPYDPGYPQGGHRPPPGRYYDSPKPFRGGYGDSPKPYGYGRRRKKSFLEGLFD